MVQQGAMCLLHKLHLPGAPMHSLTPSLPMHPPHFPFCSNGNSWEFSTCGSADFLGWADAADAVVQNSSGQVAANFAHVVYVLPTVSTCEWAGMGYIGCDGSFECRAWIGGARAIDVIGAFCLAVRQSGAALIPPRLVFLPTLQAAPGTACRLTCTSRATTSTCSTRAPWWAARTTNTPIGPAPWATAAPTAATIRPTPGR